MNSFWKLNLVLPIYLALAYQAAAQSEGSCTPPPAFVDTPHPEVAAEERLVSHTEEIIVNRPLDIVEDADDKTSLERAIDRKSSLPGVSGTHLLTSGDFGEPGSRRLVCLIDGSTLVEQVLEKKREKSSDEFRYVVWNYTTEKARPVVYGVGHFIRTDLGDGRTRIRWTYSFQLNRHRFPGYLGSLGDFLFRVGFLDHEYAAMMRGTLAGGKSRIESAPESSEVKK